MIEEYDELNIMHGAEPSYSRDVIHCRMDQLQINEDKVAALKAKRTVEEPRPSAGIDDW